MGQERHGLRFVFSAAAEVAAEGSPSKSVPARVIELSLRGCFLDTPVPFVAHTPVLVKIFRSEEYFEAKARVIYVKPDLGTGLAFREVKPHCLATLQKWILTAMQDQRKLEEGPRKSSGCLSEG